MACRIQNLGKHRMTLDLRGGRIVYLQPNEISQPLREEWLYGNVHVPGWLERGLVRRLDAKMSEVIAFETMAAPQSGVAPSEEAGGDTPEAAGKDAKPGKGSKRSAGTTTSDSDKSDPGTSDNQAEPQSNPAG